MASAPSRSTRRQTGVTVLILGCLVGVVAGSAIVAALFKPDTPMVAMFIGAGGFLAIVLLVFFGVESSAKPRSEAEPEPRPEPEPEAEAAEPEPPAAVRDPLAELDRPDGLELTVVRAGGAVAVLERATELKDAGDLEGAAEAYRAVMDTADPMAGAAALNLGVLLAKQGDLDGAGEAYARAVDAGGSIAGSAQVLLDLLEQRRNIRA
jgi:tetratricopeptide (TPR) repeat protein